MVAQKCHWEKSKEAIKKEYSYLPSHTKKFYYYQSHYQSFFSLPLVFFFVYFFITFYYFYYHNNFFSFFLFENKRSGLIKSLFFSCLCQQQQDCTNQQDIKCHRSKTVKDTWMYQDRVILNQRKFLFLQNSITSFTAVHFEHE